MISWEPEINSVYILNFREKKTTIQLYLEFQVYINTFSFPPHLKIYFENNNLILLKIKTKKIRT